MKTTETAVAPEKKQGFFQRELSQWFGNVVGDLWGGAVTTFALLPEVIGFMIVVGVHHFAAHDWAPFGVLRVEWAFVRL